MCEGSGESGNVEDTHLNQLPKWQHFGCCNAGLANQGAQAGIGCFSLMQRANASLSCEIKPSSWSLEESEFISPINKAEERSLQPEQSVERGKGGGCSTRNTQDQDSFNEAAPRAGWWLLKHTVSALTGQTGSA